MNKYQYLFVVQGHYLTWEDLTAHLTGKEAKTDLKAYRENAPETRYRIIQRRELNHG